MTKTKVDLNGKTEQSYSNHGDQINHPGRIHPKSTGKIRYRSDTLQPGVLKRIKSPL